MLFLTHSTHKRQTRPSHCALMFMFVCIVVKFLWLNLMWQNCSKYNPFLQWAIQCVYVQHICCIHYKLIMINITHNQLLFMQSGYTVISVDLEMQKSQQWLSLWDYTRSFFNYSSFKIYSVISLVQSSSEVWVSGNKQAFQTPGTLTAGIQGYVTVSV